MMDTNLIPQRLRGIEVGDVLIVRDYDDLLDEFGKTGWSGLRSITDITCGWDASMRQLCGRLEFDVTDRIMRKITAGEDCIYNTDGNGFGYFSISLDMVRFKNPKVHQETQTEIIEEQRKITLNIRQQEKDNSIIDKMISMVDFKRLQMLLSVAGGNYEKKRLVKEPIVRQYLREWAEAKYDFFVLFGEKLKIEKEIEFEMDTKEMRGQLVELCQKYPKYALAIERIGEEDFINNKLGRDRELAKYAPYFQEGMKVSKFLSMYFEDNKFDIDLSKVLQNRIVKGKVVVSIDPYDYLTMSVTNHGWRSCHHLGDGEYATGCVGYMIDNSTLIAYRDNGKEYDYNVLGFKFKGNSKSWRQLVFLDKNTSSAIFARQYPSAVEEVCDTTRYLLEAQISQFFNIEDKWFRTRKARKENWYSDAGSLHYSDIDNYCTYDFVQHKLLKNPDDVKIEAGVESVPCVHCGDSVNSSSTYVSCCLYDDEGNDE